MTKFNKAELKFRKPQIRKPLDINRLEQKESLNRLLFGTAGFRVKSAGWISARQIEAARIILKRSLKNQGELLWIRMRPQKAITCKKQGMRMGKGKGTAELWVFPAYKGRVIFETFCSKRTDIPFKNAIRKLSLPIQLVYKKNCLF